MKKSIFFLAALSVAVLLYGISKTEEFQKTYQLKKGDAINLKNINGSVKINGWKNDYVEVQVTKKSSKGTDRLDEVEILIDEQNGLNIETIHKSRNPKVSVNYVLNIPLDVILEDITSSNGSITIEYAGKINKLNTSNGAIKVIKCIGEITTSTSNGSITVDGLNGSVDANTSNGKILIENITGIAQANTSNGSIQIFNVAEVGFAKTSNGSIKAQISFLSNDITIKSSNGSINVYLDEELNADIKASTSNGLIKLHDLSLLTDMISKNYVHGQLGNGGALLKLSTSNANINIFNNRFIEN